MKEIALHLLDLAENSVSAGASSVEISVLEDASVNVLSVEIRDNGSGMDQATAANAVDPFHTSRTERKVGLGLPLLKAAAEAADGGMKLESDLGRGTRVQIYFERNHIDRMPLGDLPGTFLTLLIAHPDVHWTFTYTVLSFSGEQQDQFSFDDRPLKETLEDVPLSDPVVIRYLRCHFQENIQAIQARFSEPVIW